MGNWKTAAGQEVTPEQSQGADLAAINRAYKARQSRRRGAAPVPSAGPAGVNPASHRQRVEKQARRELLLSYLREPVALIAAGALLVAIVLLVAF